MGKAGLALASLLIDECSAGNGLADYLRYLGHDVVDVFQANLDGEPDETIIEFAIVHDLMIVTHNKADFNSPTVYRRCGGVIAVESMSPRQMKEQFKRLFAERTDEDLRHRLTLLSRNSIVSR